MAPRASRAPRAAALSEDERAASSHGGRPLAEPPLFRVLDEFGQVVGPVPDIANETLLSMFRSMMLVRALDERMMILQRQGRVGFYGTCTGQEAPPIGTAAALLPSDWIFPALRESSIMLYRGYDLETYVSQVFGNDKDVLRGRQMPSHYADRRVNVVSWGSCIGSQIPQAAGAAWGAKLRGDKTVVAGFMGDGATSEADFHYGLNFAAVLGVPCIFICQNNRWSISVPTQRQTAARTLAEKAVAYGIPYARIDGNDVLAIYAAVHEAAERARANNGPCFIEMVTYRIGAHSSSDDPRVYRDEREVEAWKERDPIDRFRRFLVEAGLWSEERNQALKGALEADVLAAVERAERHGEPARETMFDDVYTERPWFLEEEKADMLSCEPVRTERRG